LVLGQEPPFPNGYIDEVNNYLYPAIRQLQSQRDLPGNYRRTFHFPTVGCVNAMFNVRTDLPQQYQAGIFQPGASYPTFMRFSGFDQETQNTTGGDTKGLALKLYNVPGKKLLPGFENDTHHDFVFNAFPVFQFNNETVFAAGVMARTQLGGGGDRLRAQFATAYPLAAARSAAEHKNNTVISQLTMPYFGISPYKFGLNALPSPAVKYRIYPCGPVDPAVNTTGATGDYLTVDMTNRLATQDYCFYFQLQFQKDTCLHPINDFAVEWLETDTPYITVATIVIPKQTVLVDTDVQCRHGAMNAWRVLEEHRPVGSLNRARLFAMMNSHNQRLSLDNVVEPVTGLRHPPFQFWEPEELQINEKFVPPKLKVNFPANPIQYVLGDNNAGPGATLYINQVPTGKTGSASSIAVSFMVVLALLMAVL
jgi:catalase